MDINLYLQNNPNLRPRDEVRLEHVAAEAVPGERRVRVEVGITPFRERPNLEIAVVDAAGHVAAASSVIGTMNFNLALNLHLRVPGDLSDQYTVHVALYYEDLNAPQDRRSVSLTVPHRPEGGANDG